MGLTNRAKQWMIDLGLYRIGRLAVRRWHRAEGDRYRSYVRFFRDLLPKGSKCFDVGANIGEMSEAMLDAGMQVVAFEPQPDCMREMLARCAHRAAHLHPVASALGAEPGRATLFQRAYSGQSSLHPDWEAPIVDQFEVEVKTLDQAIAQYGLPDYCKMDVEGWELEVLRGLSQPIPMLSLEYHLRDPDWQLTLDCIARYRQFGTVEANLVSNDDILSFTFPHWLPIDEFLARFPGEYATRENYFFGDIFLRLVNRMEKHAAH